ncbi:MAG: transketolase, partial [Clostridiales bacterium]|nr:transketolase [Clostridiales bacterium]
MKLTAAETAQLNALCKKFRIDVLTVLHEKQTGHPGGSLSVCEILTTLYFKEMNVRPDEPQWAERDRLVLSKGHAAPMLYRVLAEKGFFPVEEMHTLRDFETRLQGHPCARETPGVDATT